MTLLHGARSGHLVRTRRGHDLPAGSAELRLHRDHGLEHGRVPSGRLPVGDGGARRGARGSSTSIRASRARARSRPTHVRIRAGSDIAFLGGIVNYILENGREFREYVVALHERAGDRRRGLPGHRGSRRVLLRLERREGHVRQHDLAVRRHGGARRRRPARDGRNAGRAVRPRRPRRGAQARRAAGGRIRRSSTRAASSSCCGGTTRRYTPELVEQVCGVPRRAGSSRWPRRCAETPAASARRRSSTRSAGRSTRSASSTSARPRSSSSCSGNIGRPGGGILALRGHASIQGSTDIPTLYNILPGYIPMPHAQRARRPAASSSS